MRQPSGETMLAGKWTYRSYRNDPAFVGDDADLALSLIFGEGAFDFDEVQGAVTGGLGMGPGYALTITGTADGSSFALIGEGIAGTATEGWRYDYHGSLAFTWPEGVDQVPCLVGSVVRVNAHGPNSPAGYTASFIAIRQSDPAKRTARPSLLTAGL
jgi:hypothetical protein